MVYAVKQKILYAVSSMSRLERVSSQTTLSGTGIHPNDDCTFKGIHRNLSLQSKPSFGKNHFKKTN